MKTLAVMLLGIGSAARVFGAERIIELSIPAMSCPVCPITVRKALEQVPGVSNVTVDFEARRATVRYEDTVVTPAGLTRATADAGYPSIPGGETR